jgi:HD superfamily phosphohydrolase
MSNDESVEQLLKRLGLQQAKARLDEQAREIETLRSFENDSNRLRECVRQNTELWTNAEIFTQESSDIHIDDPVHQQVYIEANLAPIFYHPLVQRLAHVKQLSFSYLTFPTATHSRLSHSLGVCKNAELALRGILQRGSLYQASNTPLDIVLDDREKQALLSKTKVTALLHDIGQGPFSHGLDQYLSPLIDDAAPDKIHGLTFLEQYFENTLRSCELDPHEISRLLDKNQKAALQGYDNLVSEIIDSPLDVDRMDYLVRDAHLTGLSLGTVNVQALIARMIPFEETSENVTKISLVFHPSAIPYITHLLYARDTMYLNCYEHPRKIIAEKMLMRAVVGFLSKHPLAMNDLLLLTDEQLIRILVEYSQVGEPSYEYSMALMRNSLFEEVFAIHPKKREAWERRNTSATEGSNAPAAPSEAVKQWRSGRLSYEGKFDSRPTEWEHDIARQAGLREEDWWKILVTVPSEGMYERKDDRIKILTQTEDGTYGYSTWDKLTGYWEDVLEQIGSERYCFRVFVSPDLGDAKEQVRKAAQEYLTEKRTA